LRDVRVAVARQVDQALERRQLEKIEQSRAARRLAGARQCAALSDGIDGARLAGIGAPASGGNCAGAAALIRNRASANRLMFSRGNEALARL